MDKSTACCLSLLLLAAVANYSEAFTSDYFTGAVYEHMRLGNTTTDEPADIVNSNLHYYEKAAKVAGEQGADLIVFPEYGLFPPLYDRLELRKYLEYIPDPKEVSITPCDEAEEYTERPILLALSCMAKRNEIIVIADMGARQPCEGQSDCPEDGEFNHNVHVVFDKLGRLIHKYIKVRLFYELGFDLPTTEQDPIIQTEVGKFATFICFDIIFKKMAVVSQRTDIDAILFSAQWNNMSPFSTSIQWWQAWAMGNNATLLASNIQLPGSFTTGSGIYRGREGSIVSAFNPDGIPKVVIATVPKRGREVPTTSKIFAITDDGVEEWNSNGKDLPSVCSYNTLGPSQDIYKDYRCLDLDVSNYTLQRLYGSVSLRAEVCNNGLCCKLDYSADSMDETFCLGAFRGISPFYERYAFWEENCFFARCEDVNGSVTFPMHSDTKFKRLSMKAEFSTSFIYPSLMSSGMNLVPNEDWTYTTNTNEASTEFSCETGIPVLQATFMGRAYDRDPPYVR